MSKKVILASNRTIPFSEKEEISKYDRITSKDLQSFFSKEYPEAFNTTKRQAPANVIRQSLQKLVGEIGVSIDVTESMSLNDIMMKFVDVDDEEKIRKISEWYENMSDYNAGEGLNMAEVINVGFDTGIATNWCTRENRFSIWRHKDSDEEYALYSVISLDHCCQNPPDWVETLVKAINDNEKDVNQIIMLLHDKDYYQNNHSFQLIKNQSRNDIYIAVFQHTDEKMRLFLEERKGPKVLFDYYYGMLSVMNKMREDDEENVLSIIYSKL